MTNPQKLQPEMKGLSEEPLTERCSQENSLLSQDDLSHAWAFVLDYIRMRMAEEVFHFLVTDQLKAKVKQTIYQALEQLSENPETTEVGKSSEWPVNQTFAIEYETYSEAEEVKSRVLFRIQIKLIDIPLEPYSRAINQVIDCLETYLSPVDDLENWAPIVQGRPVHIFWDVNAKPIPLLVVEQLRN